MKDSRLFSREGSPLSGQLWHRMDLRGFSIVVSSHHNWLPGGSPESEVIWYAYFVNADPATKSSPIPLDHEPV
jgi:hypothetical protein